MKVTKTILEMFRIRAETEPWYEIEKKSKYNALLRLIEKGKFELVEE